MGNSASGEDEEDHYEEEEDDYAKQFDGIETLGYRVLGVQPESPASKAGLVSFFDFIVGANHQMLLGSGTELEEGEEYHDVDFPRLMRENLNHPVHLLVWNIKAREQRVVELVPSDDWGGAGLLGVTIKLDDYGGADERLVRVLEIDNVNNGPAKLAGLIPQEDFLLGTTATTLTNADVLASLLHHHLGRVVELYVYSSTTDLVRVVGLHPTYKWGYGESMLGAAVGTGYLHRLPESCRMTIGKSVERTVSIVGVGPDNLYGTADQGDPELNESNIRMEPTLEIEVDDGDKAVDCDVGLAARGMQVQPHRLGTPQPQSPQQPPKSGDVFKPDPPSSAERAAVAAAVAQEHPPDEPQQAFQPDNPQIQKPPLAPNTIEREQPPLPMTSNLFPPPPPPPQDEPGPTFPPPQNQVATNPPPPPLPDAPSVMPERIPPFPTPPPPPPQAKMMASAPLPPPPPPPSHPDPPCGEGGEEEYTDDEEGSEYTDDEYTDDEEDETPEKPKRRGFFGFTAPPPKMEY